MTANQTSTQGPFVLLDDSLPASQAGGMLFSAPEEIITARRIDEVATALARLDRVLAAGRWVAGWIAYEAAFALEPRPGAPAKLAEEPLVWLAVCRQRPQTLSPGAVEETVAALAGNRSARIAATRFDRDEAGYVAAVDKVQDHILAGDVYQINLTFPGSFRLHGHPAALYAALRRAQPTAYSALIHTGEHWILSASPELFVRSDRGVLASAPMKGTAARHPLAAADRQARRALADDAKNRAENLMIVDLMRNDLSRISEAGSVTVDALYEVQTYPTVHQMISRITARRRAGVSAADILAALFPCGSITGAPKIRAMEIIAGLETAPRGVYTGAIGYFAPDGDLCLNVPIRTAVLDPAGRGRVHVGAGIVADSDPAAEYRESLLKARFLHQRRPDFALLETMRWDPEGAPDDDAADEDSDGGAGGGYDLLERHLARMAASAGYFGYAFPGADIRRELAAAAAHFPATPQRVRLLLDRRGQIAIEAAPLEAPGQTPVRIALSDDPVDPDDPFLYHKTTHRAVYDRRLEAVRASLDVDDVILVNTAGQITETTTANVFLRFGNRLLTPPPDCGLLAGTCRDRLLASPPAGLTSAEAVLTPADCRGADAIYLANSVRGLRRAELVDL